MNFDEFKKFTINRDLLADLFKCDVRTITNYVSLYGMPKDDRGEYPLFDCLVWFINKQRKDYQELSDNNPLTSARVKSIELNNEKKRIELEQKAGSLLDAELVELVNITFIKMLCRNIDAVAPRLNKMIGGDAQTFALIKNEMDMLKNISSQTPLNYFETEIEENLTDKS